MALFSKIVIIYNPNSTGDSPDMAKRLRKEVAERLPSIPVDLQETKHAGHAEELAYKAAISQPNTVIISVSGDGGYNEVVNGAMRAVNEKKGSPICALLPGGNANDHYSNVAKRPLIETLIDEGIDEIDLLKISTAKIHHYAHSYAGMGLTSVIGKELNKHSLTTVKEMVISAKVYQELEPLTIRTRGNDITFYSILATTVPTMAKHLTLTRHNDLHDGTFNLLIWRYTNKFKLTFTLLRSVIGLKIPSRKVSEFSFTTRTKTSMQLDGEIIELPANTKTTITVVQRGLRTLR
jgi:diacylglycerol kinase (ATP)